MVVGPPLLHDGINYAKRTTWSPVIKLWSGDYTNLQ